MRSAECDTFALMLKQQFYLTAGFILSFPASIEGYRPGETLSPGWGGISGARRYESYCPPKWMT